MHTTNEIDAIYKTFEVGTINVAPSVILVEAKANLNPTQPIQIL